MRNAKTIDIPKLPLELRRESLRNLSTLSSKALAHAVGGVDAQRTRFRSYGCQL